jgi:ribosomal-protein-alanine N-acetyltransferase
MGRKRMRNYTGKQEHIFCNGCKKEIRFDQGQESLHVEKGWGYFSKKDGERHSFDLCEYCYDKIIETFALPVEAAEATELL